MLGVAYNLDDQLDAFCSQCIVPSTAALQHLMVGRLRFLLVVVVKREYHVKFKYRRKQVASKVPLLHYCTHTSGLAQCAHRTFGNRTHNRQYTFVRHPRWLRICSSLPLLSHLPSSDALHSVGWFSTRSFVRVLTAHTTPLPLCTCGPDFLTRLDVLHNTCAALTARRCCR